MVSRRRSRLARGVLVAAVAGSLFVRCSGPEERPNVILVVLDTLRADQLEAYGRERSLAPFLDRIATESAVFTNAFASSSWTAPSTATLLTGAYPDRHGVEEGFLAELRGAGEGAPPKVEDIDLGGINELTPTLAQVFQSRGYKTFGIAANINIGQEMGFDRGFERFHRDAEMTAGQALELLREWLPELEAGQPWFLYLHLNDVHKPYELHKKWYPAVQEGTAELARYQSELGYMDSNLGSMLTSLPLDDALLVVASDHGEEFYDHGGLGHHLSLYGEVNRILMMFRGPRLGVVPGNHALPVGGIDVAPTLLELAGLPAPDEDSVDGISLAPLVRAGADAPLEQRLVSRPLFAHRRGAGIDLYAVMHRDQKLIIGPGAGQMFDLAEDPRELRDVKEERAEELEALRQLVEEFKAREFEIRASNTSVPIEPELLQQLQSLGYVERGAGE